jgi:tetratricopeptide (TPR) repeat protein
MDLFEKEDISLKTKDHKPPDTSILEYKKNLSLQYIYNSQFYPAIKEIEEILQLEPYDLVSLKRLGSIYLKLKKYQQARKIWEKALKISPDDEQLKEYIKALDKINESSN